MDQMWDKWGKSEYIKDLFIYNIKMGKTIPKTIKYSSESDCSESHSDADQDQNDQEASIPPEFKKFTYE